MLKPPTPDFDVWNRRHRDAFIALSNQNIQMMYEYVYI